MTNKNSFKDTKLFGNQSELAVANFLEQQGFCILKKNYKKFFGEIDIIASKKSMVVFVEVKARKKDAGVMHELVTPVKQRKIALVAKSFISEHMQEKEMVYRFDVALVYANSDDKKITYIPNAYTVSEY